MPDKFEPTEPMPLSPDNGIHDFTRSAESEGFSLNRETFTKWTEQIINTAAGKAKSETLETVEAEVEERQRAEDIRANKRNFNRMMTLLGALLIGLVVTWMLSHPLVLGSFGIAPSTAKMLAPYSFTITILLDSSLALYSYVRKY